MDDCQKSATNWACHNDNLVATTMNTSAKLQVLLFAGVREAAGTESVEFAIELPTTASEILDEIALQFPEAAALVRVSRLAVDGSYVSGDAAIESCDTELALIPPVSGG